MEIIILMWLAVGVLLSGMMNYIHRHEFHDLFIENYYGDCIDHPSWHYILYLIFAVLMGPCTFPVWIIEVISTQKFGISFKTSKWTQEEAKILFPNDYKYFL